jgi:hypothetical protein
MLPSNTIGRVLESFGDLGSTDVKDAGKTIEPQIPVGCLHDSGDSEKPVFIHCLDGAESPVVELLQPKFTTYPDPKATTRDCGDVAYPNAIVWTKHTDFLSVQHGDLVLGKAKPHTPQAVRKFEDNACPG